jgi:hypothetical protein
MLTRGGWNGPSLFLTNWPFLNCVSKFFATTNKRKSWRLCFSSMNELDLTFSYNWISLLCWNFHPSICTKWVQTLESLTVVSQFPSHTENLHYQTSSARLLKSSSSQMKDAHHYLEKKFPMTLVVMHVYGTCPTLSYAHTHTHIVLQISLTHRVKF